MCLPHSFELCFQSACKCNEFVFSSTQSEIRFPIYVPDLPVDVGDRMRNGFLLTTAERGLRKLSRVISAVLKSFVNSTPSYFLLFILTHVSVNRSYTVRFFSAVLLCHAVLPMDQLEKKQALEDRSFGWQAEFKHLIDSQQVISFCASVFPHNCHS